MPKVFCLNKSSLLKGKASFPGTCSRLRKVVLKTNMAEWRYGNCSECVRILALFSASNWVAKSTYYYMSSVPEYATSLAYNLDYYGLIFLGCLVLYTFFFLFFLVLSFYNVNAMTTAPVAHFS